MSQLPSYLDALASLAHADGGWGYAPGQPPQIEPTCFGLMALSLEPAKHPTLIDGGLRFLERCRQPEGSYRNGREEAIWPTPLVLFTLAGLGIAGPDLHQTASFLLAVKSRTPDNPLAGELHDINIRIPGWPWAENNFAWVEPTAWACLALRKVGQGSHERVQQGTKLLLDRAMDEGGINYGNRRILGKKTDPIPGPTALMLLALQDVGQAFQPDSSEPRLASAVQYLLTQIDCDDVEHLAWIRLAMDAYQDLPGVKAALPRIDEAIHRALEHRCDSRFLRPAPMRLALAALAVNCTDADPGPSLTLPAQRANSASLHERGVGVRGNPFRLSPQDKEGNGQLQPSTYKPRKPGLGQRLGAWFRGVAIKAAGALRPLPVTSDVHIARAASYDDALVPILQRQYEHFRPHVPLVGKRVVLKPNLVEWHRDKVINTNPRVVGAVIELCKNEGAAEIIVAEGPGHWRNVEYLIEASGLGEVLRQHDVSFIDLNHDEPVKTPNLGRLTGLEYLYLTRTIVSADVVISLPKLKTHHWAGATLSLKNLFGTLPGICYGWPKNELHWRGIDNSIVDIALTRCPDLAIVDGIIGMEGDGPLNGTAKPFGALIMAHDLVALDATCCRLMMLDPEKIAYLVLGSMRKLGRLKESDIKQLGATIADLAQPFDTVDHHRPLKLARVG